MQIMEYSEMHTFLESNRDKYKDMTMQSFSLYIHIQTAQAAEALTISLGGEKYTEFYQLYH